MRLGGLRRPKMTASKGAIKTHRGAEEGAIMGRPRCNAGALAPANDSKSNKIRLLINNLKLYT